MRKRKVVRRSLALVLSATLLASGIVPNAGLLVRADEMPGLLASFDFEGVTENTDIVKGNAKLSGTYSVTSGNMSNTGIHLNGNGQFLALTKADGSALLSDPYAELTTSYDVNYERTATNWTVYVAADEETQTYRSEKYFGSGYINNASGALTAERYYSDVQNRPLQASAPVGINTWYHVDVVYAEDSTKVYVDGVLKAEQSTDVDLTLLQGEDSVFYIGRANWEKGEYSQMAFDNLKVYGGALTPEQIKANYDESVKAYQDEALEGVEDAVIPNDAFAGDYSLVTYVYTTSDSMDGLNGGMLMAVKTDEGYSVLHKNQPVMYTASGSKRYFAPSLFHKADGSLGMIASDNGSANLLIYDSEDGTKFTNERRITVKDLGKFNGMIAVYDTESESYKIFFDGDFVDYMVEVDDLTAEAFAVAETVLVKAQFPAVEGAPATDATEVKLSEAEYNRIVAKFTNQSATGVSLDAKAGDTITVAKGTSKAQLQEVLDNYLKEHGKTTITYSDGVTKTFDLRFDSADVAEIDTNRPGEYSVTAIIGGGSNHTDKNDYLIAERADPFLTYDEETGYYYFTASYPMMSSGDEDGYDRLTLRRSKTIEGLATAEEVTIWDENTDDARGRFIWAPELHKIGGSWYFISTAGRNSGTGTTFDIRPFMVKCNNPEDMMNPASWGEAVDVKPMDGDPVLGGMSLDMTYFKDSKSGTSYVVWPDETKSSTNPSSLSYIYIATVDESNPTQLTSKAVRLTIPEYNWEQIRYNVNEGPSFFVNGDTVYMTFSASGTGSEYCVGLMMAPLGSDLLDLGNWYKQPYPILTSQDFDMEVSGPGHNSFTTDENGNLIIVYHARPTALHSSHSGDPLYDPCRMAYIKAVYFDEDKDPVFNLSERDFAGASGDSFDIKVVVDGELTEGGPVLEYNFDEKFSRGIAVNSGTSNTEDNSNNAKLKNGATYVEDKTMGQVLYLDGDTSVGGTNSYLQFPEGFFDGMEKVTISMDVNEVTRSGNYFTFTVGQDTDKYLYLKTMPTSTKLVITEAGYKAEKSLAYSHKYPNTARVWVNYTMVVTEGTMKLYADGKLVESVSNTGLSVADLGENLSAYLGKSFYSADNYFRGYFDNVKVYDYAMTEAEVGEAYASAQAALEAKQSNLSAIADSLSIPNADNVRGNITLPTEINGATIKWTSSNPEVICPVEKDGKPAGVVTRQDKDVKVTLTALVTKNNAEGTMTRKLEVTVKAAPEAVSEDDMYGYLFVRFTGTEEDGTKEQTYFSVSKDGLNWTDLNNNQPVLTSTIGESGLRDHFIARSPEGDKFYMIATDLSIANNKSNAWPEAGSNGSHSIVVWETYDLVNWSEPWLAEIAPENAGCTWAPEFIYDETTGEYVCYWASTTLKVNENGNITQDYENHTIYYAKTRDFRTWTDAEVFHQGEIKNGTQVKVIDSTMIEHDGTYYRYTKNESVGSIVIDKADTVLGTYTDIPSDSLAKTVPNTIGAVEGPIIYKLNGQDRWVLLVDRFARGQGYYPLYTDDLSSGEFTLYSEKDFSMPTKYRHGYVMSITKDEYKALTAQDWMQDTTLSDENSISLAKSNSSNPLLGFDASGTRLYGGDPSILVEGDTVYAYVGHDVSSNESYNMPDWQVYSSKDMVNWTSLGKFFDDSASNISWAKHDNSCWAAQVVKFNGKYFFLYCTEGGSSTGGGKCLGIAVSDNPTSGFKDIGHPFVTNKDTANGKVNNWEDIDPTGWVETDENGVDHLIIGWGNSRLFSCEADVSWNEDGSVKDVTVLNRDGDDSALSVENGAAYLEANGTLPDIAVGTIGGMTGHSFTEAPYYYRQQDVQGNYFGKYYLFFACDWREQMAYATCDTYEDFIANNWTFGDVIQEPSCTGNTNHMAVFDFKGDSYFVYHDGSLPHGSGFRRVMCAEKFTVNEDGSIPYIPKTAVGLTGTVSTISSFAGENVLAETFSNTLNDADYPMGGELTAAAANNAKQVVLDYYRAGDEADWEIQQGFANSKDAFVSIESNYKPGLYLMEEKVPSEDGTYAVRLEQLSAGNASEYKRATFKTVKGLAGKGVTFESVQHPGYYLVAKDGKLVFEALTEDTVEFRQAATFFVSTETRVAADENNLEQISVRKTKRMYLAGSELSTEDIRVMATMEDGGRLFITDFGTNADELDMSVPGEKKLDISFTISGVRYTKTIVINVVDGSFNN